MLRDLSRFGAAALLPMVLSSCSGGSAASGIAKPPPFDPKNQTKCGVTKSQASPLIVEWPDPDRGQLESLVRKHVVAVRYVGCEMQVLARCTAPGRYEYSAITRKVSHVHIGDVDELYANIPVFAAKFEGTLQKAGELNVAMTIVGRYEADRGTVRKDELHGDCDAATHVVTGLTVGAFDFYAGAEATVGGGVAVGGAGAGAKSSATRRTLNQDGEKAKCDAATTSDKAAPDGCGALLRVEVVPLGEAKRTEPVCPAGTKWDGAQCVGTKVVTHIQCPAGTTLQGNSCVANVSKACGAGLHFEDGKGCVPNVGAQPGAPAAVELPRPAPAAASRAGGCPAGMAEVPGGTFMMGSADGDEDERPVHSVTLSPYCLDVTEVTVAAYAGCRSCRAPETGGFCNAAGKGKDDHPQNCVSWDDAVAYCQAVGKRLPTEAEWEFAARAGSEGRKWPWGSLAPTDASACWNRWASKQGTCRVRSYDATAFGLHDLAGNVWEWVSDYYGTYPASASNNYAGPPNGSNRVDRGGSWYDGDASRLRGAYRGRDAPSDRDGCLGFRCARTR